MAADRCVEQGTIEPLSALVPPDELPELQERLVRVLQRRHFDVDDLDAGRAYIEAYTRFFKRAEGEGGDHHPSGGH